MTEPTKTVAAATEKAIVNDARGRVIAVKKLGALDYYRLTKAMGASASSPATMDLAILASSVRRIDTQDYAAPYNERDIEILLMALDFDGLAAAGEGLKQLNEKGDGTEAAKN
jgi:hypothetical protein